MRHYSNHDYFNFISKLVKNGISGKIFAERAELLVKKCNPKVERIDKYVSTKITCVDTLRDMVNSLLKEFPTKRSYRLCAAECKSKAISTVSPIRPEISIKYQTQNGKIDDLQQFLNDSFQSEKTTCHDTDSDIVCEGTIIKFISDMHIFIEAHYWNGKHGFNKFNIVLLLAI